MSPRPATQKCRGAKRKWLSPAMQVPRRHGQPTGTKRVTRPSPVSSVPCLPRKTKVDVAKRHFCHAKRRWMSHDVAECPPATPSESGCCKCHACHARVLRRHGRPTGTKRVTRPSPVSYSAAPATQNRATPATIKDDGCHQVPSLRKSAAAPRATNRDQARYQTQPSPISATPATQNEGRCRQVPSLPRKTKMDVAECHA